MTASREPDAIGPTDASRAAEAVTASAARLRAAFDEAGGAPRVAVLLGSGWAPFAAVVQARPGAVSLPYEALPAFPPLGVGGHAGRAIVGRLAAANDAKGPPVLVLAGRKHSYEHGDASAMKGPIRALAAAGITTLVLTNAAGSLRPEMPTGSLMLLTDHLNLPQLSPLFGEAGASRFVDLRDAYAPALRARAHAVAASIGQTLFEGVYAWAMGPQFETPAEIRMMRTLGADAVGMSTVPETILARHAGLKVLGITLVSNLAAGLDAEPLSHAQTLAAAEAASGRAVRLLEALLPALAAEA